MVKTIVMRLERHELNWKSLRRFILFFPLCLYVVGFSFHAIPVVIQMKASDLQRIYTGDGFGHIRLNIEGVKFRGCSLIPDSTHGDVRMRGKPWYEVEFNWYKDYGYDSSRASSGDRQSFGTWQWTTSEYDAMRGWRLGKVEEVRLTLLHHCDTYTKLTTIGPFDVRPSQSN